MPKWFSEQEKELIHTRLLEQGYKMFSAYGLKKTNIEEIARAVGISKGAFYSFYESKEALFMDVVEEAEKRVRREILAAIDLPGATPRARLFAVFKKAITLFQALPILHIFSGSDYDLLFRRIPAKKLQEHLTNDQIFIHELVARCQKAGILIRVQPEQIVGLLYPLVLNILHDDTLSRNNFNGNMDLLLELIAAFCLGEIEPQLQPSDNSASDIKKDC
jgi:AcrR family transcriptional regulator